MTFLRQRRQLNVNRYNIEQCRVRSGSPSLRSVRCAAAPASAGAQAKASRQGPGNAACHWRNRPSFQFGDVRLDIRFKTPVRLARLRSGDRRGRLRPPHRFAAVSTAKSASTSSFRSSTTSTATASGAMSSCSGAHSARSKSRRAASRCRSAAKSSSASATSISPIARWCRRTIPPARDKGVMVAGPVPAARPHL